jgi:hypothetical protein
MNRLILPRNIIATLAIDGPIVIGQTNDYNITMDHFTMQARLNGAASGLYLNYYGGDIVHALGVGQNALNLLRTYGSIVAPVMRPIDSHDEGAYTTTSLAYVSLGSPAGLTFVAPYSGCVFVTQQCVTFNNTAGRANLIGYQIEAGGSGGAIVVAAAGGSGQTYTASPVAGASSASSPHLRRMVSGLTGGGTYFYRPMYAVNAASTGTFQSIYLAVEPLM